MLNCTHILEFVQSPPPLRAQRQQSNLITPPTVWHKNQDKIKNVELFTHFSNCAFCQRQQLSGWVSYLHNVTWGGRRIRRSEGSHRLPSV